MKPEQRVLDMIASDPWRMDALYAAAALRLPDCWIGGGFVRNRVWDCLHHFENSPLNDIDVVYFDRSDLREATERAHQQTLQLAMNAPWSVKNQARMHTYNKTAPFTDTADAISHWVETPTCIAVRITGDTLELCAPHGVTDLLSLTVRPSPKCSSIAAYQNRTQNKGWIERWPQLRIYLPDGSLLQRSA